MDERDNTTIHLVTPETLAEGTVLHGPLAIDATGVVLAGEEVYGLERHIGLPSGMVPTALAADRCGVLTVLAGDLLSTFDPCSGELTPLPCFGGTGSEVGRLASPQGLALGQGNLIVADTANHRVYLIAQANGQIRRVVGAVGSQGQPVSGTLAGQFDRPVDVAFDCCGHLYVLESGNRRIQKFDGNGEPLPGIGPFGADRLREPVALACGIGTVAGPAGERLTAPLIHCLDRGSREIVTFDAAGRFVAAVDLGGVAAVPAGLAVDGEGKFYVADGERFIFAVRSATDWHPLEEYQGRAVRLRAGTRGELYALEAGRIAMLTRRRRYPPAGTWAGSGAATGVYLSRLFDTGGGRIHWHRVTLDADIPDKTQVRLSYVVSGSAGEPAADAWQSLPPNPADALFVRNDQGGRYLRLRLELISEDRQVTPVVRGIHLQFPKQSYLRYLPAVYQEDSQGRSILERFLSLFESILADMEEEIFTTRRLSDPWATPADFLPWLASWLALGYEKSWPEPAVRRLIDSAADLYRQRGTRAGITALVALFTGARPLLVEPFQLDCIRGRPGWEETLRLFRDDPYHFTVLLPEGSAGSPDMVRQIVDRERPAHTCATVVAMAPLFRLGDHTYLEVNTWLNEPEFTLETAATLSRETYLVDREHAGQAHVRGRVAIDTYLT